MPDEAWDCVTADFITGLPKSKTGYDAIPVFVDRLTKYVHIAPTRTTCSAEDWAELFFAHVVVYHGLPKSILLDRGSQFIGHFNQALAKRLNLSWDLTTAYKPFADGQTERTNRVVEQMLCHYVSPQMDDWDKHLGMVQFAINNAWQSLCRKHLSS